MTNDELKKAAKISMDKAREDAESVAAAQKAAMKAALLQKEAVGKTALMLAAEMGNIETVKYLLEAGSEETALMRAARQGNIDIATMLLERGADTNAKDTQGYSPLHLAASQIGKASEALPAEVELPPEIGEKLKARASKKAYADRPSESGKPKA